MWTWALGHWQCQVCARRCLKEERPEDEGGCPGVNEFFVKVLNEAPGMGHHLAALAIRDATVLFCTRCGGYTGKNKSKMLTSRCAGRPQGGGKQQLQRVCAGWHPRHGLQVGRDAMFDLKAVRRLQGAALDAGSAGQLTAVVGLVPGSGM